jgi:hypothetical protein
MKYVFIFLTLFVFAPCYAEYHKNMDCNCDGQVNIADVTTLINYIFGTHTFPLCPDVIQYPLISVLLDTTTGDISTKIVEIVNIDTSYTDVHNYASVGDMYTHTYLIYKNGVLCDSSKFLDITRRMWIDKIIDTFPQGCGDLTGLVLRSDSTSVNLCWAIPGTNGEPTIVEEYDLRYSTILPDWSLATRVVDVPISGIAGTWQQYRVTGLAPRTTYYFRLKYRVGSKWSDMSNVATKTTGGVITILKPIDSLRKYHD